MLSTTELLVPRPPITLSYSVPPSRSCFPFNSPNSSLCMDTSTRTPPSSSLSLNCLSSELIALVFEQLRDLDTHTLTSVRLVSKRFDAIAAPIAYRFLTLNEALVAPDAERRYPDVFRHISHLTNHVIIPSNLNSTGINSLLSCIKRLKSVRWQYVDGDIPAAGLWLPSDLRRLHHCDSTSTQLHIENLPLRREYEGNPLETFIRSIPAELLTSLKLANPTPVLSTRLNSLKQLLIQARQLNTLCYEDRGQGTCFNFLPGETMPPINNLLLRSYDWQHTAEDVGEHWDFSEIRSLELVSVPIFNFLKSVLRFRDHVGFSEDDQRCPTLPPSGLAGLGQQLKFVHTLELDLDTRLCDPFTFLRATMIQPLDEVAPGIDRDYEAAMKTFQLLVQEKERVGACAPWKRIAVNVGGWKRVMIRRLGGIWRRRNNMGIYAERCFVLERDAQSGRIAIHEEVCVEPSSHGGSPSP
ncbi:hypothetical protein FLONG3_933 [Fusarium longipes]|uniref:F-box domain-containing protein n=1 Tax=Fusarium longipes TaxID=694270 RepID=A0A395T9N7_9HYPO|nr:hypothetical protein FLONG3_933 [Fusarium longipes]